LLAARLELEQRRYFCIALMSDLITGTWSACENIETSPRRH
jgi:hypothetical protein